MQIPVAFTAVPVGAPLEWFAHYGTAPTWRLLTASLVSAALLGTLLLLLRRTASGGEAVCGLDPEPATRNPATRPQSRAEGVDNEVHQLTRAAVLFTDILGFTSISEQMVLADLLGWLDGFFVRMREEVLAEGGMVDKFIGDSVLAVFGVPQHLENPCNAAFQAARRMQGALTQLNRAAPIGPGIELRMGVGIHYGPVIAGPLGGLAYTVLGDTVNTAHRIEKMTRITGHPILFSGSVHKHLRPSEQERAAFLGTFDFTGKMDKIDLFGCSEALWS